MSEPTCKGSILLLTACQATEPVQHELVYSLVVMGSM